MNWRRIGPGNGARQGIDGGPGAARRRSKHAGEAAGDAHPLDSNHHHFHRAADPAGESGYQGNVVWASRGTRPQAGEGNRSRFCSAVCPCLGKTFQGPAQPADERARVAGDGKQFAMGHPIREAAQARRVPEIDDLLEALFSAGGCGLRPSPTRRRQGGAAVTQSHQEDRGEIRPQSRRPPPYSRTIQLGLHGARGGRWPGRNPRFSPVPKVALGAPQLGVARPGINIRPLPPIGSIRS